MARTFDLAEAAAFLHIGEDTLRERAHRGDIPGAKIAVEWVFLEDALVEYLRDETKRQTAERKANAVAKLEGQPAANDARKPGRRRRVLPALAA
jgi:hypothetical protein